MLAKDDIKILYKFCNKKTIFFYYFFLKHMAKLCKNVANYRTKIFSNTVIKCLNQHHAWYAWSIWCIGIPGYNNCSWESDDTTLTEYICQNASKCVRKKSMMYKKGNHITDLTFFTIMYSQGGWKSPKLSHLNFRAKNCSIDEFSRQKLLNWVIFCFRPHLTSDDLWGWGLSVILTSNSFKWPQSSLRPFKYFFLDFTTFDLWGWGYLQFSHCLTSEVTKGLKIGW